MQASVRARAAGAGAGFVMEMDVDVQRPSGSLHLDFLDGFTRCAARAFAPALRRSALY